MSQQNLNIARNSFGQLVLTDPEGKAHLVTPVRAFPIAAPAENIGLINTEGEEVAWIERLSDLPDDSRQLIADEMASREFIPVIQRIHNVSSFATPSTWDLETDRGRTSMVLKGEEDIRRLGSRTRLLIAGGDGLQFRVKDTTALDKHSRRLLERFL